MAVARVQGQGDEIAGDDLTRIIGIGTKTAERLRARGIGSFAALADQKTRPEYRPLSRTISLKRDRRRYGKGVIAVVSSHRRSCCKKCPGFSTSS